MYFIFKLVHCFQIYQRQSSLYTSIFINIHVYNICEVPINIWENPGGFSFTGQHNTCLHHNIQVQMHSSWTKINNRFHLLFKITSITRVPFFIDKYSNCTKLNKRPSSVTSLFTPGLICHLKQGIRYNPWLPQHHEFLLLYYFCHTNILTQEYNLGLQTSLFVVFRNIKF